MEPEFLELEQVVQLHRSLSETYGGSDGLREMALL